MREGDPARSEAVPTLQDMCVGLIRRHIDRVDDLGAVPDQIVRRLLLHPTTMCVGSAHRAPTLPPKLTPEVLERVESGTLAGSGQDLTPVTDDVWREFLRRDFPGVTVPPSTSQTDAPNRSAFRRLTAARRRREADASARLRATYATAARTKDARVAKVVHLVPRAPRRPAVSLPAEAAAAAAKRARVENAPRTQPGGSSGMPSTRVRLAAKLGMGAAFRGRGGAAAAAAAATTTRRHDRATGITTTTRRAAGGGTVTITRTPAGASTGRIDAIAKANVDARRGARAVPREEEDL
jgi:hypothetical protein